MLVGVASAMQNWRQSRRAERALLALDERHLADIGITRSVIAHAAPGKHPIAMPTCGGLPIVRRGE
jgi:uncharacterized protein YjiS (DUF1127 family)